ncbi:MAG: N-acetyltransferase [Anaerolineales bacterium]
MKLLIRSERPADYSAIAGLNYEAFVHWRPTGYRAEPVLVDLLRHHELFDPELSLVAESDGRVVGHALFTPWEAVVLGTRQRGMTLAPVCVAPAQQRQGIGSALLVRGHEIAQHKGIAFSLLCGHPDYYPRFGYQPGMFSLSGCRVTLPAKEEAKGLCERPVRAADLAWVTAAWDRQHRGDTLALYPGESIGQWFSHASSFRSSVFCRGEQIIGYAHYRPGSPVEVRELLAAPGHGGVILSLLAPEQAQFAIAQEEGAVRRLLGSRAMIVDERDAFDALMIKPLDPHNEVLAGYCAAVASGHMAPGILAFPPTFDLDE